MVGSARDNLQDVLRRTRHRVLCAVVWRRCPASPSIVIVAVIPAVAVAVIPAVASAVLLAVAVTVIPAVAVAVIPALIAAMVSPVLPVGVLLWLPGPRAIAR